MFGSVAPGTKLLNGPSDLRDDNQDCAANLIVACQAASLVRLPGGAFVRGNVPPRWHSVASVLGDLREKPFLLFLLT
jgi:hypothetical protein